MIREVMLQSVLITPGFGELIKTQSQHPRHGFHSSSCLRGRLMKHSVVDSWRTEAPSIIPAGSLLSHDTVSAVILLLAAVASGSGHVLSMSELPWVPRPVGCRGSDTSIDLKTRLSSRRDPGTGAPANEAWPRSIAACSHRRLISSAETTHPVSSCLVSSRLVSHEPRHCRPRSTHLPRSSRRQHCHASEIPMVQVESDPPLHRQTRVPVVRIHSWESCA